MPTQPPISTTPHALSATTAPVAEPDVVELATRARAASRTLATLSTHAKNAMLLALADAIDAKAADILHANRADCAAAEHVGLPTPKLQRLTLTPKSIAQLAVGIRQIAALPDPVGQITTQRTVDSGLRVRKVRAPLGVIAMIYEARPGVTIDAFALCFKAGNACILRGGKEAALTNSALASIITDLLAAHGLPTGALVNLSGSSRAAQDQLLTLDTLIDLVIPRGGRELIEHVCSTSRIPTIQHFQGVCHVYVDESADVDRAIEICATAKSSAPATCNALECVLVHKNIADRFVPRMLERFAKDKVEVRGTPLVRALSTAGIEIAPAAPEDFGKEFLDLVVAMRIVASLDEAVDHINTYGSSHTEAILTRDLAPDGAAELFTQRVQSSCVLVNASTRFNDGFQLGLGAEIGISTSRIHAYGPMGLEELTTQRYIVIGDGHVR